ncbi:MAG: hypothetical protein EOS82_21135 [Mesorhizobium sp.]|uniref:hypothetical protein n=1 Tax=Mesorhizobium sp. TaxID=1871066 RepID=UPI000FE7B72C|nr:hypothetical protein [Mesorhizobium sp.]RWQ46999.1 MAG: hypothetical protein EOS82_21135 [Mesorhizobium sp.]
MQYEIELDGEDSERLVESLDWVINKTNVILEEDHDFPHLVEVFVDTLNFEPIFLEGGEIEQKVTVRLALFWGEISGTGRDCEGKSLSDALARVKPDDLVKAVICETAAEARLVLSPDDQEKKALREVKERAKMARIAALRRVF